MKRINETALKGLLKGPVHTLAFKSQDQKMPEIDACSTCLAEAYYNIDLRARIDQLVWQTMLLLNLKTPPWIFTPYNKHPKFDALFTENSYGCFSFSTDATRLRVPIYCRSHKVTEVIDQHYSQTAWLLLTRPTQDAWLECITVDATRSHLCHMKTCENPYHSVQEVQKGN